MTAGAKRAREIVESTTAEVMSYMTETERDLYTSGRVDKDREQIWNRAVRRMKDDKQAESQENS